ncbi:MAG: hypothetical protein L6428_06450 [Candidatus Aminicenantes bacterium]|nr:hypothetical protein [Candidatus Aminicenantes bacterium]
MSDHENTGRQRPDDAGLDGTEKAKAAGKRCAWKKDLGSDCDEWGWWEDRTLPQKILIGIGFAILGIALAFLFGWVVMLLWNWLMPDIFGLKRVTYWQAWGLLILCCILFKDFGSGHSGGRSDRKRRRQLRHYMREDHAAAGKTQEAQ